MSRKIIATFVIATVLISVAVGVSLSAGRGPDPQAVPTARGVADRIMSPFCPGLTLTECPTVQSAELRNEIAAKTEQGWTNQQIDQWLVDDYGRGVLGRPPNPLAWAIPVGFLILAGSMVWRTLARRREPEDKPQDLGGYDDSEKQRLSQELEVHRGQP